MDFSRFYGRRKRSICVCFFAKKKKKKKKKKNIIYKKKKKKKKKKLNILYCILLNSRIMLN